MKKIRMLAFLLLVLTAAGIALLRFDLQNSADPPLLTNVTPSPAPTPVPTPAPTPTPEPTPVPTPTPTPDPSLHVKAGHYMEIFEDEETNNYLEYWLYVPENAVRGMPLMVFLHGDGYINATEYLEGNGCAVRTEYWYGQDYPYLLLAPCTRTASWELDPIPETLIHLIDFITETYACDTSRIMLTGHSRGAIGTWYLASRYSDVFCCAVPLSCPNDLILDFDRLKDVPVRAFVGSQWDDYNRYGYDMKVNCERIREKGGDAELTVLDGLFHGDTEIRAYTRELFEWMLAQKRS